MKASDEQREQSTLGPQSSEKRNRSDPNALDRLRDR